MTVNLYGLHSFNSSTVAFVAVTTAAFGAALSFAASKDQVVASSLQKADDLQRQMDTGSDRSCWLARFAIVAAHTIGTAASLRHKQQLVGSQQSLNFKNQWCFVGQPANCYRNYCYDNQTNYQGVQHLPIAFRCHYWI